MQLFALQFILTSFVTYFHIHAQGTNPYGELVVVAWMLLTVIAFGLALAMLCLASTCLVYAAKNITKIDLMKGTFKLQDKQR
jgi:hypothetical protein